jgi:hypothetical protein
MSRKSRAVIFLLADFIGPAGGRRFKSAPRNHFFLPDSIPIIYEPEDRAVIFLSADFIGRAGGRRFESDPRNQLPGIGTPTSTFSSLSNLGAELRPITRQTAHCPGSQRACIRML